MKRYHHHHLHRLKFNIVSRKSIVSSVIVLPYYLYNRFETIVGRMDNSGHDSQIKLLMIGDSGE